MSKFTRILIHVVGAATVILPFFIKNPKSQAEASQIESGVEAGIQILEAEVNTKK